MNSINRTFMELKQWLVCLLQMLLACINRTFMELKLGGVFGSLGSSISY